MPVNIVRMIKRAEKLRGWVMLDQKNRLLYEKEVIPAGDWKKLNSEGEGIAFAVLKNTLQHWRESLRDLRAAGIKSPLAKSHDTWDQPEDRLGEVIDANVRANDKGKPSLFLRILFDDEKSRDIGLKGDVSIGSPEEWYDGTGRKWDFPLQHVASTNAPVIPGLETWQKIAASFSASNKSGSKKMELDELIAMLGIEVDESVNTDDGKKALIMAKLKELAGGAAPPPPADDVDLSHDDDDKPNPAPLTSPAPNVPQAKKVTVAFSHDDPNVSMFRDSTHDRVDTLVTQKVITPATAKHIKATFLNSKDIAFSMNHKRHEESKKILELVKLVAADRPLKDSGRSPAHDDKTAIELSHKSGENPLNKNAEKRAAAAAGRK